MGFTIELGAKAPDFNLPGVDGESWSLEKLADARLLVVGFTCNHCPYVVGSEDRMMAIVRDYADAGVRFIAINSNETENHPDDGFPQMVDRARERDFNFPYLRDEDQAVAKAFGAIKTPQFFVLDENRIVRYRGRMDDNPKDPAAANTQELRDALDDLLAGKALRNPDTDPIGCTIKWWGKDRKFIPTDVCDLIFPGQK